MLYAALHEFTWLKSSDDDFKNWIRAKISTFWYENIHISVLDLCIVFKLQINQVLSKFIS